ncbi:hypothetical protein CFD26_104085 [Aspergillus turcosus]|uniref:Glycine-rich domain-containing protein 1 n=1 Tax=Aspergillus turcosus TaxID=1245748 RepID=A0A3R7M3G9_9EURO|nr:hypothetical protein CFD26_104085 [Aspergillus turcosus]
MTITQELVKEKAANDADRPSAEQPPGYDQIDEQAPAIPPLDLSHNAGSSNSTTVTRDQCVVHLKFLASLADLRDSVAGNEGLFGLHEPPLSEFPEHVEEVRARIREKRWAVYTARAVDRYTKWWETCIPSNRPCPRLKDLENQSYDRITEGNHLLSWSKDSLPPLGTNRADVLMVWHAHMLNPRGFLEDCIRSGKMSLWAGGFPWETINYCIDNRTLDYDASDRARVRFNVMTRCAWDNLHDPPEKFIECVTCENMISVPWTQGRISLPIQMAFDKFDGYADKGFNVTCWKCGSTIDHERLRVRKFRSDVVDWLKEQVPMPGTLCNSRGIPESIKNSRTSQPSTFPNRFIKALGDYLLDFTDARQERCMTVSQLRDRLESKLKDRKIIRERASREEGLAFRHMMSHYWNNTGPFALDLVGAVIRQGTFVQKMDHIDWLHSPTVMATMGRLIRKYHVFFHIMASHPQRMAVPTLDVDLAWHTHQLSPKRYFEYSVYHTRLHTSVAKFIDHDDKVDENQLSDGFEWTSKIYRKVTDGEIYSECACWYCEAIRAPDLRSGPFVSSTAAKAREAAATLHDRPDISSDPDKNPHISAHNAVRAETTETVIGVTDPRRIHALKLRQNYEKARRRAEKRNRKLGKKGDPKRRSSSSAADDNMYAVPMVWGVPVVVPYYGPYMCDPCVHPDEPMGTVVAHAGALLRLEAAVAREGHAVEVLEEEEEADVVEEDVEVAETVLYIPCAPLILRL